MGISARCVARKAPHCRHITKCHHVPMSARSARAETSLAIDTCRCLHFSSTAVVALARAALVFASILPSILSKPASLSSRASTSGLIDGFHVIWVDFCSKRFPSALASEPEPVDEVVFFPDAACFNSMATFPRRFGREPSRLSVSSTESAFSASAEEDLLVEFDKHNEPTTEASDTVGTRADTCTMELFGLARHNSTSSGCASA